MSALMNETTNTTAVPIHQPRVLLMCEEGFDVAAWREFLKLPGCTIQVCHNYVEFLLYLEHEPYQLAMVFGKNLSPDFWTAAARFVEVLSPDYS